MTAAIPPALPAVRLPTGAPAPMRSVPRSGSYSAHRRGCFDPAVHRPNAARAPFPFASVAVPGPIERPACLWLRETALRSCGRPVAVLRAPRSRKSRLGANPSRPVSPPRRNRKQQDHGGDKEMGHDALPSALAFSCRAIFGNYIHESLAPSVARLLPFRGLTLPLLRGCGLRLWPIGQNLVGNRV